MIFQNVAPADRPACAVVCREWQVEMEKQAFKTLDISSDDVVKFYEYVARNHRRQTYVKDIVYRIQLPDSLAFGTTLPRQPSRRDRQRVDEENQRRQQNRLRFIQAIVHVLRILSLWKAEPYYKANTGNGLALELAIDYNRGPDPAELYGITAFHEMSLREHIHDYQTCREHLPEVPVVGTFRILRSFFSCLEEPTRAEIMLAFPRLTQVRFEQWYRDAESTYAMPVPFCAQLMTWPRSVRKMSIYQALGADFGGPDVDDEPKLEHGDDETDWCILQTRVGAELAQRSRSMQELSVCNVVEAENFFVAFEPSRYYLASSPHMANMRFLTLTTSSISPHASDRRLNLPNLLRNIALFIPHMPALCVFELFKARDVEAGRFQVVVEQEHLQAPRIVVRWASTWRFTIEDNVKMAWINAAMNCDRRRNVHFEKEELIAESEYFGPAQFIVDYLLTRHNVLHPSTLQDIAEDSYDGHGDDDMMTDPLVKMGFKSPRTESNDDDDEYSKDAKKEVKILKRKMYDAEEEVRRLKRKIETMQEERGSIFSSSVPSLWSALST